MTNISLLPPNHTKFESDLEQVSSRISNAPVAIRDVWNPDTCPLDLLPWLAWALSIDTWKDYWPESIKRARLRNAVAISRRKGTRQSLSDVIDSFGTVMELDETSADLAPFQFNVKIDVNNVGAQSSEFTRDVIDEISRTKRSSSYFELHQKINIESDISVTGRVRVARFVRLTVSTPVFIDLVFPTELGDITDPRVEAYELGNITDSLVEAYELGDL